MEKITKHRGSNWHDGGYSDYCIKVAKGTGEVPGYEFTLRVQSKKDFFIALQEACDEVGIYDFPYILAMWRGRCHEKGLHWTDISLPVTLTDDGRDTCYSNSAEYTLYRIRK